MRKQLGSLVIACLLLSVQTRALVDSLRTKAQALKTPGASESHLQLANGVTVDDQIRTKWNDMKTWKKNSFFIYKITADLAQVVIEHEGAPGLGYEDMLSLLPEDDCRFAVFPFTYQVPDGDRERIVFVQWAPDSARIKNKILYADIKDTIKKVLQGVNFEVQGTDLSEISFETVMKKAKSVSSN